MIKCMSGCEFNYYWIQKHKWKYFHFEGVLITITEIHKFYHRWNRIRSTYLSSTCLYLSAFHENMPLINLHSRIQFSLHYFWWGSTLAINGLLISVAGHSQLSYPHSFIEFYQPPNHSYSTTVPKAEKLLNKNVFFLAAHFFGQISGRRTLRNLQIYYLNHFNREFKIIAANFKWYIAYCIA